MRILIVKYYIRQHDISNIYKVVNVKKAWEGKKNMACLTSKETINNTVYAVNDVSFNEKKDSHLSDEEINRFLDDISEVKKILDKKKSSIDNINQLLQKISWLGDLNEECLKLLNILILVGKDFHTTLTKGFPALDKLSDNKIAETEVLDFKECVEDLADILNDLEMSFFTFPKDEKFLEATKLLALL